jgi:alpha-tubulin suppressor-like RCC1 family protein
MRRRIERARSGCGHARVRVGAGLVVLVLTSAIATALPTGSVAEQASQPKSPAAGQFDAGANHTCAVLPDASVRCWGYGGDGELGYGNTDSIGDDETPASVAPLDFGPGRSVKAISAGTYHSCAILDDGTVRCWGFGAQGRLGYGNTSSVYSPASAGPVDLGAGRTAVAISAGGADTCAIRDDGSVLCWGYGADGELGYGDTNNLGDTSTPGAHPPVDLGGHTAKAISVGALHTCAILDDRTVRCWGYGLYGRLGYGDINNVGDGPPHQTPASASPVYLGVGRTAVAISAGGLHTCAILDNDSVLCWGNGAQGQLGYGDTSNLGDTSRPGFHAPVDLGGRTARAISAGTAHTCAILDNGSVLCWGNGADGRLGYGNTNNVGDTQTPASVGPVDLGPGRTALAISAGGTHTCAMLDNGSVRCWGYGANGQLGYCSTNNVGDAQTPGSAGPVNLQPGDGGAACKGPTVKPPVTPPKQAPSPGATQAARARALRGCLAQVRTRARRADAAAGGSKHRRALVRRQESAGLSRCLRLYGRTPGHVTGLRALARGKTKIVLYFRAPGTDANHPPPARSYVVKQSLRPIRSERDFTSAQTLCSGACRFPVTQVGGRIALTITSLSPRTTYYYAVAARDNVSARLGPRSPTAQAKTA